MKMGMSNIWTHLNFFVCPFSDPPPCTSLPPVTVYIPTPGLHRPPAAPPVPPGAI